MGKDVCPSCGGTSFSPTRISNEILQDEKIYVVENILAHHCTACDFEFPTHAGNQHIEKEMIIFSHDGLENRVPEIMKKNKIVAPDVARHWNTNKINVYQMIKRPGMNIRTCFQFLQLFNDHYNLDLAFTDVYVYRPVYQKDGKYYLSSKSLK